MVHASLRNYRKQERFTGPRRPRYKSLIEARKDAELPAGEFEIHHDGSRRRRDAGDSRVGQGH